MVQFLVPLLVAGCSADGVAGAKEREALDSASIDESPPVIEFTPLSEAQPYGQDVVLTAVITDESTLLSTLLHFRAETSTDWSETSFVASGEDNEFTATIAAKKLRSAGINYYLEAVDTSSNITVSPPQGAEQPYHFRLTE